MKLPTAFAIALFFAATAADASAQAAPRRNTLLDANTTSREQVLAVPGVDAALADAIIQGKPYVDVLAFDKVIAARLNEAQRKALYEHIFVPLDLNTAPDAAILLIPGVGPRMLREFKEYRPYRSIEQFRREIGKYVSDDEVARMERYVVVR